MSHAWVPDPEINADRYFDDAEFCGVCYKAKDSGVLTSVWVYDRGGSRCLLEADEKTGRLTKCLSSDK